MVHNITEGDGVTKQKNSRFDNLQRILCWTVAAVAVFAWYHSTFNPDMTYMCRYYIGEHPVGGDAYLDSSTLDSVMACRLDQRRYKQTFNPIRSCTAWDIEYGKSHPKNEPFCVVR